MTLSGKDKLFERHRAFKLFCAKKNPDKIGGFLGQYLFRCPYLALDRMIDTRCILAGAGAHFYSISISRLTISIMLIGSKSYSKIDAMIIWWSEKSLFRIPIIRVMFS